MYTIVINLIIEEIKTNKSHSQHVKIIIEKPCESKS